MQNTKDIPLHFVVGNSRSGTTLMSSILNQNPIIKATPENRFILHFWKTYRNKSNWTTTDVQYLVSNLWLRKEAYRAAWKLDEEKLVAFLNEQLEALDFPSFCKAVYFFSDFKEDQKISALVDKNPPYALHIPMLSTLFPESKFVVMVRDYRDNVASRRKHRLDNTKSVAAYAEMWKYYYSTILEQERERPDQILVVQYEDLIKRFSSTMSTINRFLNLPAYTYDKDNIPLEKHIPEETESNTGMHNPRSIKIHDGAIGKWKQYLSDKELLTCNQICNSVSVSLGYEENALPDTRLTPIELFNAKINVLGTKMINRAYYFLPTSVQIALVSFLKLRF